MSRKLVSSGSPYESIIGFSRAVRAGSFIAIGGTAAIGPDGETVGIGAAAVQARRCFEIIEEALEEAGGTFQDVIRTRILLTDIDDWQAVAKVHGEYFSDIRPAATVMQVSRFINPEWLIEVEVDAIIT